MRLQLQRQMRTADGSAATASAAKAVTISLVDINEAPANTIANATKTTAEDTAVTIDGLSVADVDAGDTSLTVTLTSTNGTLSVANNVTSGLDGSGIAGSGTGTVTLTGTIAAINATLAGTDAVQFTPTLNFTGKAAISITSKDDENLQDVDADAVGVTVTAVDDAPEVTSSATGTANEENLDLAIYTATASDVESEAITFTLGGTDASLLEINPSTGVVSLKSQANFESGKTSYAFTVTATDATANDGSATASAAKAVTISLVDINEAPANTIANATKTTAEDTAVTIDGLSVADVDAGDTSLTVTLTSTNGTLSVANNVTSGLDGSGIAGSGTGTVTLTGTIAAINATLAGTDAVQFTPTLNFTGAAAISITSKDDENLQDVDADAVGVTVTAVDDAPEVTSSATGTANEENSDLAIYTATASDVESEAITFTLGGTDASLLEINPSTGVVSLKSQANFESGKTSYAFTVTATDAIGDGC